MSEFRSVIYNKNADLFVHMMGFEDNPDLAHWGPCIRNHYILHYVTTGKGYFNENEVLKNQGFFIKPSEICEYHSDDKEPWNYFWIIFSKEIAKKYVLPYINLNENDIFEFDFCEKLVRKTKNFFNSKKPMSYIEGLSSIFSIMAMHTENEGFNKATPLLHIQNAKTFIENNFDKKITVCDVAKAIHINERYLYNIFIANEGIPPKKYIDAHKINAACTMLVESSLSISNISLSLGFDDISTFSKFFSNKTGVSPNKYRNDNKTKR